MAGDLDQNNWKDQLKLKFPQYFNNVRVADIGSADINGTNKSWFENSEYVGLDIAPWANVDVVSVAHEYDVPDGSFDVVCSTNHLEHDIYWEKTLKKMVALLKYGGLMFFQTVHLRPEHGTKTKNPDDSLTTKIGNEEWANFYKQFTIEELRDFLKVDEIFSEYKMSYEPEDQRDIYFWGIKRISLDVGCGTLDEWIEGDWVRVDPYVKEADLQVQAWELPYKDGEVDFINSDHMLEHCYKAQIIPTLKEWFRVLKSGGKLTLKVPDLAWCCQWWLEHQTSGWDMDIIFGGQSREGEAHHTGFNREIMINYLHEAGFKVEKFEELETHSQKTLSFECEKGYEGK